MSLSATFDPEPPANLEQKELWLEGERMAEREGFVPDAARAVACLEPARPGN
jgi:hypothetical protein